ncbi:UNVERIFIED_CONTAM: hypothetical protein Sangu_3045400 [Sesamum angustifolium]|uniref:Gag/pol protein n=1 Tax=Sesamum angustifolium TaxID=2727405 RepID=A0AAW2KE25_9LAMI
MVACCFEKFQAGYHGRLHGCTELEYIAVSKVAKETVWMKNYIQELDVVPSTTESVIIFYDNNGAIA